MLNDYFVVSHNPANNRNTIKSCKICSKLTIRTPEWPHSGVFTVNFEHKVIPFPSVPVVDFEHVIVTREVILHTNAFCSQMCLSKFTNIKCKVFQETSRICLKQPWNTQSNLANSQLLEDFNRYILKPRWKWTNFEAISFELENDSTQSVLMFHLRIVLFLIGVGKDLSHIETISEVSSHLGEEQLADCVKGCSLVLVPAGMPRKPGIVNPFRTSCLILGILVQSTLICGVNRAIQNIFRSVPNVVSQHATNWK